MSEAGGRTEAASVVEAASVLDAASVAKAASVLDAARSPDTAREEGLIEFAERAPGISARAVKVIGITVFLLVVAGTAVVDRLNPVEPPQPKGQELLRVQKQRDAARFGDGTLAHLIEDDLEQSSRIRSTVSQPYKLLLYRFLDEAGSDMVITGKDGWLFVRGRTIPPRKETAVLLEEWAIRIRALTRGLEMLGMRVVVLPVPRKAVVEEKYLPSDVDPRGEIDQGAARALTERGTETVDLYPLYMGWDECSLFYRADAHWNEVAERVTAEESLRALGMLAPEEERKTSLEPDVFETQGLQGDLNRDLYWLVGINPPQGSELLRGPDLPANNILDHRKRNIWHHHNPKTMPEVALTGTSYSARRDFSLLLEHFGQCKVYDASIPAQGPIVPITRFLKKHRGNLPKLLLAEIPVFSGFDGQRTGSQITQLLSANPPEGLVPLGRVTLSVPVGENAFDRELVAKKKGSFLLRTMAGALLTSWDNVLGVRLRGEVYEGKVEVRLLIDDFSHPDSWEVGENESYFALVAPGKGGQLFPIFHSSASGTARFKLNSVEFVTCAQLQEAVPLTSTREEVGESGYVVEFELDPRQLPVLAGPRECAVVVQNWLSSGEDPFDGCTVELIGDSGRRVLTQGKIATGGWVLCSLGGEVKSERMVLRFSGPGTEGLPRIRARLAPMGLPADGAGAR